MDLYTHGRLSVGNRDLCITCLQILQIPSRLWGFQPGIEEELCRLRNGLYS